MKLKFTLILRGEGKVINRYLIILVIKVSESCWLYNLHVTKEGMKGNSMNSPLSLSFIALQV